MRTTLSASTGGLYDGQEVVLSASPIFTISRNIGGSVGIAAIQALTVFNTQTMHSSLAGHIVPENPFLGSFLPDSMSPDTAMDQLMLPQLMRAAGQPLATIPLTQLSVVGLTRRDTADSAGITSVMRNLGASIGIAMLSTVVQIREQVHFSVIAEAMSQNSLKLQERLQALAATFTARGVDLDTATQQGTALLLGSAGRSIG